LSARALAAVLRRGRALAAPLPRGAAPLTPPPLERARRPRRAHPVDAHATTRARRRAASPPWRPNGPAVPCRAADRGRTSLPRAT